MSDFTASDRKGGAKKKKDSERPARKSSKGREGKSRLESAGYNAARPQEDL